MRKEINSWRNSKKLEKSQNIINMSKKNNKPLQLTSINSLNNINIKITIKVRRLKPKITSINISSD